jgi:hypothetical protein
VRVRNHREKSEDVVHQQQRPVHQTTSTNPSTNDHPSIHQQTTTIQSTNDRPPIHQQTRAEGLRLKNKSQWRCCRRSTTKEAPCQSH